MRAVLHSDLNNFYASAECLGHPELKNRPVVVGGAEEERHGIVLAKNMVAKQAGVTTGMTIWQAKKLCPDLVVFRPNFSKYIELSRKVKSIYRRYTDKLESFGIDECWLDVTGSLTLFGSPMQIAEKIRKEVLKETGLTVSVGVSFNKVFAKLGSDLKKPNAVTEISKENFKDKVWPLAAKDMLGVGPATAKKLEQIGIKTIGELAASPIELLTQLFGKNGELILKYAKGEDDSPVFEGTELKSIGNSMTHYKDITDHNEACALLLVLAESVAARLLDEKIGYATTVHLWVRESDLFSYSRQVKIAPSTLASDFYHAAEKLLIPTHDRRKAIRALGISISGFVKEKQITLENNNLDKKEIAQKTIEKLRNKFGRNSLQRALIMTDKQMAALNIKEDHLPDASKI